MVRPWLTADEPARGVDQDGGVVRAIEEFFVTLGPSCDVSMADTDTILAFGPSLPLVDGSRWASAPAMSGVSKSQVSRLCGAFDERVGACLNRPIERDWPYLWIAPASSKLPRGGAHRERGRDRGEPSRPARRQARHHRQPEGIKAAAVKVNDLRRSSVARCVDVI